MRKEKIVLRIGFMLLVAIVLTPALNCAFGATDQTIRVSMVVAAEAKQGKTVPAVAAPGVYVPTAK